MHMYLDLALIHHLFHLSIKTDRQPITLHKRNFYDKTHTSTHFSHTTMILGLTGKKKCVNVFTKMTDSHLFAAGNKKFNTQHWDKVSHFLENILHRNRKRQGRETVDCFTHRYTTGNMIRRIQQRTERQIQRRCLGHERTQIYEEQKFLRNIFAKPQRGSLKESTEKQISN